MPSLRARSKGASIAAPCARWRRRRRLEGGDAGAGLALDDRERALELGGREGVPGDHGGRLRELARAAFDVAGDDGGGVARGLVEGVAHRGFERALVAGDEREAGGGEREGGGGDQQQRDLVDEAHRVDRGRM